MFEVPGKTVLAKHLTILTSKYFIMNGINVESRCTVMVTSCGTQGTINS